MSNLPSVNGKIAVKLFEAIGYEVVRVTGSHHIMKREGSASLINIPVHGNKSVKKGLLTSQIKLAGITVDEAIELLNNL